MLTVLKQIIVKALYPLVRLYWRLFQPTSSGARALVIRDGKILLVKASYGTYWQLPGGTANKNEAYDVCATRETLEETGIQTAVIEKLGTYTSTMEGKRDTIHIYIAEALSDSIKQEWELKDAGWFALDALPADVGPATKRRITEYASGQRLVEGAW